MRCPGFVLAVLLVPQLAAAQAVRGRVVGPDSAAIAGAIVTLIDSVGVPRARALADDQGRFTFRLPAPGGYRVEVKRLGFRPSLDPLPPLAAGQVVDRTIVVSSVPVSLRGVHVTAQGPCLGTDSSAAGFAVWEEARKALVAAELTRAMRDYTMDVELFVNQQSSDVKEPPVVQRGMRHTSSLRPFSTRAPEELVRDGYVARGPRGDTYYAPDEHVLLSESFATTHCLALLPDSASPDLARLGFVPLPDRRTADIRGVLTVDRATAQLRTLEFQYTNLRPDEMIGSPGGQLAWRCLPEGSWIIEYWAIGLPVFDTRVNHEEVRRPVTVGNARPPAPRVQLQNAMRGRITTGGGVSRIAFGDTIVWMADQPLEPRIRVPLPP